MPECLYVKQVEMKKHLSPLKDKKKDIELVIDLITGNSDSSFFLRELTESVISSK
ncbi:18482_t:CDS:2 [Funneliformis geosporum]|uniref:18482_t:CDS:1 n=1 Tax=Funneliformis geosporum TaxID=1117311 RepID=A0A9W4SQJ8_9GLOM|nr:18482_t:CDS:2 [Funneliformis geosporum]